MPEPFAIAVFLHKLRTMLWEPRILTSFKKGEISLFYDRLYPGLLLYAARQLGSRKEHLAEDCVQDAVFKAWDRRESFPSVYALKAFLFTTIRNEIISIHRKDSAQSRYMAVMDTGGADDHALIADLEAQSILFNAINELPDKMKRVIEMSFIEGLKNQEIADRLSVSLSSVNQYKAQSLKLLREKIKPSLLFMLFVKIS